MENHHLNSESVTLLIQHRVKDHALQRYETWLSTILAEAAARDGHQGAHVIRPPNGGNEYSIIVRFSSIAAAESWTKSDIRKKLIAEIADSLELPDKTKIHPGIDFWFTPPALAQKRPKGWKQWLVTTSVIWPLTLIIPPIVKPLFQIIPVLGLKGIREGLIAAVIVALVVFVIMPRYVRAVSGWLNK